VNAARGKPGQLTLGGTATNSEDHIFTYLFEQAAKIKVKYAPFNSRGEVTAALIGGMPLVIVCSGLAVFFLRPIVAAVAHRRRARRDRRTARAGHPGGVAPEAEPRSLSRGPGRRPGPGVTVL
jgi:hypothetical protein